MSEYVVLVNDHNEVLGTSPKLPTHHGDTPLHRGFSVFLFNQKGELLLQQRGKKKKTWPLVWSNSCCGHPMLEETSEEAAQRRLSYELGITDAEIETMLPNYRYRCERDSIVENEICPVLIAFTTQTPRVNPLEVEQIRWISWSDWLHELAVSAQHYSPWCVEESKLLEQTEKFQTFYRKRSK